MFLREGRIQTGLPISCFGQRDVDSDKDDADSYSDGAVVVSRIRVSCHITCEESSHERGVSFVLPVPKNVLC